MYQTVKKKLKTFKKDEFLYPIHRVERVELEKGKMVDHGNNIQLRNYI